MSSSLGVGTLSVRYVARETRWTRDPVTVFSQTQSSREEMNRITESVCLRAKEEENDC